MLSNVPTIYQMLFFNEFSNSFNFLILSRRPGEPRSFHAVLPAKLWMHLAVVACGDRVEETLVMLKSAVLFSHRKMQFHIFTEESLKPEFDKQVNLQKSQQLCTECSWAAFWEMRVLFTGVFCCKLGGVTVNPWL